MSTDIFVDRSGRRRRVLTWLSVTAAALLVGALGLLAAGLFGGAPLPLRGWTEAPGPDSAVIGPAPTPTPAPPPTTARTGQPATRPATAGTRPATTSTAAQPATTGQPGRGNGRSNKPTAKPDHPQPKAG
ncbi:hypothetical protein AB0J82_39365 [Asanoa sp. NPDC049518]|uniref:hypothetical protein n=1 Tax=unclassified Asanoa TaxID=2685164 RepID=UPI00341C4AA9